MIPDDYYEDDDQMSQEEREQAEQERAERHMVRSAGSKQLLEILSWFDEQIANTDSISGAYSYAAQAGCTLNEALAANSIVHKLLAQKRTDLIDKMEVHLSD
jgi:hypothetical protein